MPTYLKPKPNITGEDFMTSLSHTLIRTSLAKSDSDWIATTKQRLHCATKSEWHQSLTALEWHRLTPLVFYSLKAHGLADTVPPPYLAQMQAAYQQTRLTNADFRLMLVRLLRRMGERNLHPVLWKGMVLADNFYPDPGTRPMGDIDFAIAPEEMDEATEVFQSLGFEPQDEAETEDAIYFANKMGVICDVHHRVRLFEGKESMNLTIDIKPQRMSVPTLRILEPNAMVVHLIVHMDGHRPETGLMLQWILDLAFVFRQWGTLLEPERLEKLIPAKEHWVSLFRTIRFLEQEFGEKPPTCLAQAAKNFQPLTLEEILRQRRLALWGLPYPRGWLRLGASRLGFRLHHCRPEIQASDLFLGFTDAMRNRRNMGKLNQT